MGFGGISIWQLLIVLLIVVLIFGTKKIRNMGGDLGSAVKNFKKAIDDGSEKVEEKAEDALEMTKEKIDETVDNTKDNSNTKS